MFQQPTRLNVIKNDNESWDYTKPYWVRRGKTPAHFTHWCPTGRWRKFVTIICFYNGEDPASVKVLGSSFGRRVASGQLDLFL